MRIVLDLTALLPEATGVDTYLRRLPVELGKLDRESRYTVFVNAEDREVFTGSLPANFTVRLGSLRPRPVRLLFQQVGLPLAARRLDADVVHSPSFILPLLDRRPRHVLSVHDMTFFSLPEAHIPLRRSRAYRQAVVASIRRASRVLVPSRSVADAVARFVPDVPTTRVRVVPLGVGPEFTPGAAKRADAVRARLRLPERFVLYVGTIEPRKGLDVLLDAYAALAASNGGVELVLAGRLGWDYDGLVTRVDSWTGPGRVRRVGYVAAEDLPALYASAGVTVYPSREEGFGFPPLEAMSCGVPVVATDTSSLGENLRGAAELVPPGDTTALADALRRLLGNARLRDERRRAGLDRAAAFRWEDTAAATLDCYREVAREAAV